MSWANRRAETRKPHKSSPNLKQHHLWSKPTAIIVLFFALALGGVIKAGLSDSDAGIAEHLPYGFPNRENILYRTGYLVSSNDRRDVPNWVCYHLTAAYLAAGVGRTNDYRPDPDVLDGDDRADLSDYRGSGYDRGHLAPAADMARSRITMSESFLLTNIAPQAPGFNRGIWKRLETEVRGWAVVRGDINVCTGPVYLDDDGDGVVEFDVIGRGQVAVPDAFFKIVVAREDSGLDVIAFILRNRRYPHGANLADFIVSVDEIESLTGLDFLSRVHDDVEEKIESERAGELWRKQY